MPSISKNVMINEMRERKRLQQAALIRDGEINAVTLSRITQHQQTPYNETSIKIISKMDVPVNTLFNPFLENQPITVYKMRNQLLYYLDRVSYMPKYLNKAVKLLNQIKNMNGFETGINKQFILSCQARLGIIQNEDPQKILRYIHEGIKITYPEYTPDTFDGDALLYEEARLIHTQALAYARGGNTSQAVNLLQRTQDGLSRLPQDDKDKIIHLAPVMLDLSNFLMGMGDYKQALAVCKKGNDDISITRTKGRYAPDFTYNKARALYHLKQTNDLPLLLESAFHGYIMLRNPQKAREVKTYAQSISIEFNLFDVNELPNRIPDGDIDWGKPIPCTHFGEFMNGLRSEAKITLEELCEGLCNKSSYVKKEKSKSMYPEGSVYLLEGLMQRLGRDIDGYFYTLLNDDDFKDKQLRDKIYVLLVAGRCDEVEPLLNDLSTRKQYKEKINLQFIKMCQAELCGISHGFGVRYKQILTEAWHVTKKKLNEDEIEHMRLTRYEIIILNETALYLCNNGEAERGLNIFDSLTKNIKKHCVDETERMKTYLTVLYNYTKYLGINNKRPKALALAKNGLELSVKYKDLWHAPLFMTNIAVNLFQLGEKKKSVPYFAQAYFGSVIMRRTDGQKAICKYVKEHLGITFI